MANEKRLIDASAWESWYKERQDFLVGKVYDQYYDGYEDAIANVDDWMDAQPAVDAVEVVRCKDCKNSRAIKETDPNAHEYAEYCVWCIAHDVGFGKDDFCSYGERREGE